MAAKTHIVKVSFPNSLMIRLINTATEVAEGSVSGYIRELIFEDLMKRSILSKDEYAIMREMVYGKD